MEVDLLYIGRGWSNGGKGGKRRRRSKEYSDSIYIYLSALHSKCIYYASQLCANFKITNLINSMP